MAQRNSRHTELSDSLSETKSVPSAPSDRLTTTSSDSHSQLSVATPSPLPVVSNQECAAISDSLKEIPKPPASLPAQKITVSTAVGPSPPREIPMHITDSKPVPSTVTSTGIPSAIETQTINSNTEIPATESKTKINSETSCKPKMVTSTGTSPPPQSISTQVWLCNNLTPILVSSSHTLYKFNSFYYYYFFPSNFFFAFDVINIGQYESCVLKV
jgi:hypothetical protein